MKNSGGGAGGLGAIIVLILGVLCASGIIQPTNDMLAKLTHTAGIALIVGGVLLLLLVIGVFVAAMLASKPDPDQSVKDEVNKVIGDRRQQLASVKSNIAVMNMDLRKLRTKIAELDKQIAAYDANAERCLAAGDESGAKQQLNKKLEIGKSRDRLVESENQYLDNLAQLQSIADELESGATHLEQRRNDAIAKLKTAETLQSANMHLSDTTNFNSLDELEKKAQYEEDYNRALESLNDKTPMRM